jgi:hypothetical protein
MVPGSPELPGCNVRVQFTVVFVLPLTVALNCCVAFGLREAVVGLTVTETADGVGVGVGFEAGVELFDPPPPHDPAANDKAMVAKILSDR